MVVIAAALAACGLHTAHPALVSQIISVESGGNPLALHINRLDGPQPHAASANQAAAIAKRYIKAGYRVDIGLMQIDSENLAALGLSIRRALDPCPNIAGGTRIIDADLAAARQRWSGKAAREAALSAYNTGNFYDGMTNGYVAKYVGYATMPKVERISAPVLAQNPYTAPTAVPFKIMPFRYGQ